MDDPVYETLLEAVREALKNQVLSSRLDKVARHVATELNKKHYAPWTGIGSRTEYHDSYTG